MKGRTRRSGKSDRAGSVLIACLIIIATLTVYGGVLISVVYERSLNIELERDRLSALYLAEAGLAKSLYELKQLEDEDDDGLGSIPVTALGNGTYSAQHDPGSLTITGLGEVNGLTRRVQLRYEGL